MTDILWYSTEENVNWGAWREVERLPLAHRITRWFQKKLGYRYVVGVAWPARWQGPVSNVADHIKPLIAAVFGPVAPAQNQVVMLLQISGAIEGEMASLAVAENYDLAKAKVVKRAERFRPRYEVSAAVPVEGGFEAIYTPID